MRLIVRSVALAFAALSLLACQASTPGGTAAPATATPQAPVSTLTVTAPPPASTPTPSPTATPWVSLTPFLPTDLATFMYLWPTVTPCPTLSMTLAEEEAIPFGMEPVPASALPIATAWSKSLEKDLPSPDGGFVAILRVPDCGPEKLLVLSTSDGSYRQIRYGRFPSWRPFSGLVWLSDQVLQFDIWGGPHGGRRFTVDVASERLLKEDPIYSK